MLSVSLLVCAMMALTRANDDEILNVNMTIGKVGNDSRLFVVNAGPACPGNWIPYGDRCFYLETTKKSWAQAEKNCQSLGGNLASVHSEDEYIFIQSMTTEPAWIGGSDCQERGAWFWIGGAPMDYTFWCPSQPDNTNDQCCLQMNIGDGKCWDDQPCNKAQKSICVKKH
ncbi:type-2 ice-structuring protein-like [Anoplopoma fimbria]|uniref:type-2 ice-structuring protein-like n=1 Tax=Anoplopoma fimbria TaxID=229290 RepID=UPI0023EC83A4|nr:type-2 ice-structuring protein-like [Anoplopoma fimbria]